LLFHGFGYFRKSDVTYRRVVVDTPL